MSRAKKKHIKKRAPRIYIDTNIARDYSERRDFNSIHLLETIREKEWECFSSPYLMMELCDIEKDNILFNDRVVRKKWTIGSFLRERRNPNLKSGDFEEVDKYLDVFIRGLKFVNFLVLDERGWNIALLLSIHSNLAAPDVIHFATAFTYGCDIFVTRDGPLMKEGSAILKRKSLLKEMGVKTFKISRPNKTLEVLQRIKLK